MCRLTLPLAILVLFLACASAAAYPAQSAITVKVFYPDGAPAAGISVALQNGNYAMLGNATTDSAGTCAFNVSPGSSAIRALVKDHNVTSVWHEAGNTSIEVYLPRVGEVTGAIKLDGMGAGNPLVVLDDSAIFDSTPYDVSRQNGSDLYTFKANRFSLTTTMGHHTLYAIGYSNGTIYSSDHVAINVSEASAPVLLELKPSGTNASTLPPAVYDRIFHTSDPGSGPLSITGILVDANGVPMPGITLTAQDYFLKEQGLSVSGPDGSFVFGTLNVSTDFLRFKVAIPDNGTELIAYTQFYTAQDMSGLEVKVLDYPKPTLGYIYGIIALTDDRSNPVPVSGTVYLSNGLTQQVSPDRDSGQFSFALAPGSYEIYAEHVEGSQRLVSETRRIEVAAAWSAFAVNPTVLVVGPEKVQYVPLTAALALGALCLIGAGYAMRKWL